MLRSNHLAGSAFWTEGRIYLTVVWVEVLLGSAILLAGMDQPVVLLLISTSAASVVTLVYAALLIKLNRRSLPEAIRMRGARLYLMIASVAFYAFFAIMTVRGELLGLLGG
ncbi:MAG: hypothetical protein GEV11_05320 [Streptosporangiales bacterium]|nr:hypothetical protein [Streptosporangiales bacterium]